MSPAARRVRPGGLLRFALRCPIGLYRVRLDWLLGHRFALVTHRGRRSGRVRRTVVELVRYEPATKECIVAFGRGARSDWYRDLRSHPALLIESGHDRYVTERRFLAPEEVVAELRDDARRHPNAARLIGRCLGVALGESQAALSTLAAALPMVSLRPTMNAPTRDADLSIPCTPRQRGRGELGDLHGTHIGRT